MDVEHISATLQSDVMNILFLILGSIGCPGNLLVIVIIMQSKNMRIKPFNILILHQSTIDFLVRTTYH